MANMTYFEGTNSIIVICFNGLQSTGVKRGTVRNITNKKETFVMSDCLTERVETPKEIGNTKLREICTILVVAYGDYLDGNPYAITETARILTEELGATKSEIMYCLNLLDGTEISENREGFREFVNKVLGMYWKVHPTMCNCMYSFARERETENIYVVVKDSKGNIFIEYHPTENELLEEGNTLYGNEKVFVFA